MMHHAQIAQRAFNTPLMVDPAKPLAFLSGLGPRITGKEITFQGLEVKVADQTAASLPARASLFGNDLAQRHQRNGIQPFAVVDGIALIEITGTLVHRGAWIGQSSGLTSYAVSYTHLDVYKRQAADRARVAGGAGFRGNAACGAQHPTG